MEDYRQIIDDALRSFIQKQPDENMYKHMEYFLGFRDEHLSEVSIETGKRFRPLLTLMIANDYGGYKKALSAAVSIELFHNFSLIHDDIVDNDTLRRGRKTVWKAFGTHNAINSGDAQLLLACRVLLEDEALEASTVIRLQTYLLEKYQMVAEGQALDFALAEKSFSDEVVNEETYRMMTTKKTAVLIGAATAVAGIVSQKSEKEIQLLYDYGTELGLGYQLYDDYVSLWGTESATGKQKFGDIIERKKNLPALYAYQKASAEGKQQLLSVYEATNPLAREEVALVLNLIEKSGAEAYMKETIEKQKDRIEHLRNDLSLSKETNEYLHKLESRLLST